MVFTALGLNGSPCYHPSFKMTAGDWKEIFAFMSIIQIGGEGREVEFFTINFSFNNPCPFFPIKCQKLEHVDIFILNISSPILLRMHATLLNLNATMGCGY